MSKGNDKVPTSMCPNCDGFVVAGEGVVMKGSLDTREYCSSDCVLDAWQKQNNKHKDDE